MPWGELCEERVTLDKFLERWAILIVLGGKDTESLLFSYFSVELSIYLVYKPKLEYITTSRI